MRLLDLNRIVEECIGDMLDAEYQLILALPRVAGRVHSPELKASLEEHLVQTHTHATRLVEAAKELGLSPAGRRNLGMQGLLKEGDEAMGWGGDPWLVDQLIISACRKVENYEMVAYEQLVTMLQQMDRHDVADTLMVTLREERQADQSLRAVLPPEPAGSAGQALPPSAQAVS